MGPEVGKTIHVATDVTQDVRHGSSRKISGLGLGPHLAMVISVGQRGIRSGEKIQGNSAAVGGQTWRPA